MIGEIASFSNALGNALTNTLGGKATQLGSWRNTLRYSSSLAMVLICLIIIFNLETLSVRVVVIGIVAGLCGGLGLPAQNHCYNIYLKHIKPLTFFSLCD